MATEEERLLAEAKRWPWEERCGHRNWKLRADACGDMAAACAAAAGPRDPRLRELAPLFKKLVSDSNAAAQERGLDALIAFLEVADAEYGRFAKETCDAVAAKCLTGRTKTVEKALAVFLLWVELEAAEQFLDTMEKAVENKVAKAVVPAIDALFQAVNQFGTKVIPAKRVIKLLPKLFNHADQSVRAAAKGLTVELCRWIGKDAIKRVLLDELRDATKKELESEIEGVSAGAVASRRIRSEQDKVFEEVVAGPAASAVADDAAAGPCEVDEYEFEDPVNILSPLEKTGFWDGLKAAKWMERRDAVAELTKVSSVPKIAAGDFLEIYRSLKKLMTDVNIAVATEAIQATGNLARGLRANFSGGARLLLPVLLDKFKEKKPTILQAVREALQAIHKSGCLPMADFLEDVKLAAKNKVPGVRAETLAWITFCVENSKKADLLKLHKEYVPLLMESLQDSIPEVRDSSFLALASLAKAVGLRPLERSIEKLDDVRRKKLTELIAASGSDTLDQASTNNLHLAASNLKGAVQTSLKDVQIVRGSAAASLMAKRSTGQVIRKPSASSETKPQKSTGAGKAARSVEPEEDLEIGSLSVEEVEMRLAEVVKSDILQDLKSANWKERLEAMGVLNETVDGMGSSVDVHAELLVRLLSVSPGWGDKNIQVMQKMLECITTLAHASTKFSKRCVLICLPGVIEKLADTKTRMQAAPCLTAFCETVGPQFVFERMYKIMKEHKNPKVQSEGLLWMAMTIEEFGVGQFKLKELLNFCKAEKSCLDSSNAAVRTAAIKVLGCLHKFVGPGFLTEVRPALMTPIDAEFEKNPYEGPPKAPKRQVKTAPVKSLRGDALPREDIGQHLTPALLADMSSPEWKIRQESIECVNAIISEANGRIQVTGTGELFISLKTRLSDSNKNLAIMAMATLGHLAGALGASSERYTKLIIPEALKSLSDNKKMLRDAVLRLLTIWSTVISFDKMIVHLAAGLADPKLCADGRRDLLDWVAQQLPKASDRLELLQFVKPAAACLQDKAGDVRKAAESTVNELVDSCTYDLVLKAARDELKPPTLAVLLAAMEKKGCAQQAAPTPDISFPSRPNVSSKPTPVSVKSRCSTVKVTQSGPKAAKQAAEEAQAEERERHLCRRLKFEEPRPEHAVELEVDMAPVFREDLVKKLCSKDFKIQVGGIDMLQRELGENVEGSIQVIDLVLRWITLRLCESNTTSLLKVLEFLPQLVDCLKKESYTLTDAEANIFIPCLVEKLGHNISNVREKMRELMRNLCCLYPASKVFAFIVDGLKSKNNRTRVECVEHIEAMIERHGVEIVGSTKALAAIASLSTERDADLRKAALNALATAYTILGDDVWKHLGKVSETQKGLIEDKFKWKVKEMQKKNEGMPGDGRAALRRSQETGLLANETTEVMSDQKVQMQHTWPRSARDGPSNSESPDPETDWQTVARYDWNKAMNMLEYGTTLEQEINGMKVIMHELTRISETVDSQALEECGGDVDHLTSVLSDKVMKAFSEQDLRAAVRLSKYSLKTLLSIFMMPRLARRVGTEALQALLGNLIMWLISDCVAEMEEGSEAIRRLNSIIFRILEAGDPTTLVTALIGLYPRDGEKPGCGLATEAYLGPRGEKFNSIVMKCLMKLCKVFPSLISELDLDTVLKCIHDFLDVINPDDMRQRAAVNDQRLVMVKTVLFELCRVQGPSIKGYLSLVPLDRIPPPTMLNLIDLNLQSLAEGHMSGSRLGPKHATSDPDINIKEKLAVIMRRVSEKKTSMDGMYELYKFRQQNPRVDIFSHLHNTSDTFHSFIRNGLAQVEENLASRLPEDSAAPLTPPAVNAAEGDSLERPGQLARPHSSMKLDNLYSLPTAPPAPGTPTNLAVLLERMRSIQAAVGAVQGAAGVHRDHQNVLPSAAEQKSAELGGSRLPLMSTDRAQTRAVSAFRLQARMMHLKEGRQLSETS
eukprot:SM000004S15015  [mRNA]  locus=s4:723804:739200:- [translate_table: standard]